MPKRPEELPLRRPPRWLLLSLLLSWPAALEAQEQDASLSPVRIIEGFLEVTPRLTRVLGQTSPLLGAAAALGIWDRWRVGGSGHFLLERVDLEIPPPLPGLELHLGYGGVLVERSSRAAFQAVEPTGAPNWLVRFLVGAGNAELRDSGTGTRQRSDNFLVVETSISLELPVARRVHGGLVAGYRWVTGVDGLGAVEEADLRGVSVGFGLRLGPF
jgi:hypothetical protein